jgi:hypothetical protein
LDFALKLLSLFDQLGLILCLEASSRGAALHIVILCVSAKWTLLPHSDPFKIYLQFVKFAYVSFFYDINE